MRLTDVFNDLIEKINKITLEEVYHKENTCYEKLLVTSNSRNLVYVYDLETGEEIGRIDDTCGIMFGDSGNCTFLISKENLQKCDFSQVEYDWQCC